MPVVHAIETEAVAQNVLDALLPDRPREELVDDDPLIVPANQALRLSKSRCGGTCAEAGSARK